MSSLSSGLNLSDPNLLQLIAFAEESKLVLSQINIPGTIGVGLLGCVISAILYGVTCVQTFNYFRNDTRGKDPVYVRTLVVSLWVMDTIHQAIVLFIIWHYVVTNYANPPALLIDNWSIPAEIIARAFVASLVEAFLCLRLWLLSKNKIVVGVCLFWTAVHLTLNLIFPIRAFFYKSILAGATRLKTTGASGLTAAVVADSLIAGFMVYYLRQSRTGFRRSDGIITKLIQMSIMTGGLTTMFAIGNLVAYLMAPRLLVDLFFNAQLAKLSTITLLTTLNARDYIRSSGRDQPTTDSMLNSYQLRNRITKGMEGQKPLSVSIHRVTEQDTSNWTVTDTAVATADKSFDLESNDLGKFAVPD